MFRWLKSQWSRLTAGIALAAVAAATGVISYRHIYELSIALHQPPMVARLQPVGIDGLIVVGSVVLLQATLNHPYLGWFGVVPGVAASVFANIESGIAYGWLAAGWAGVPAAGFALATFLLERWLKDQVGRPARAAESPDDTDLANFEPRPGISTAVYRLHDTGGDLLYVGMTWDPEGRFKRHAKEKPWWGEVDETKTKVKWYATRAEAALAEFAGIHQEHPKYNKSLEFDAHLIRDILGDVPAASGPCGHEGAMSLSEAVVNAYLHGRDCLDNPPSQRQLSASFELSRQKVAEMVGSLNGSGPGNEGEPG